MYCVTLYLFFIRRWCNLNEFLPNLTRNLCPVEFEIRPVNLGGMQYNLNEFTPKSTSIYLSEFTQFTPNLTRNLCPVKFDRAWNTAQFGLKFMDLHPIWAVFQAWSNWVSSQWIYSHFEQYFRLGRIGYHPNEFTPILSSISCPVKFDRAWNTAQNGCKFTGINCLPAWSNWVSFQWIQLASNSTGIYLNGFTPNLTGRIRPGMKYCSKWVEIHWNYTILQWKINTKLHNTSEVDLASKSTGFIKLLHFWVFQYFLSPKSTFITCPQTGQLQF